MEREWFSVGRPQCGSLKAIEPARNHGARGPPVRPVALGQTGTTYARDGLPTSSPQLPWSPTTPPPRRFGVQRTWRQTTFDRLLRDDATLVDVPLREGQLEPGTLPGESPR